MAPIATQGNVNAKVATWMGKVTDKACNKDKL